MSTVDTRRFIDCRIVVPDDTRLLELPVDQQCFIDLEILTGFYTAAAQDALVWVVPVESIAHYFGTFGLMWRLLVADPHFLDHVMYLTVAVVEITDCTVEFMISQNTVHSNKLRLMDFITECFHDIPRIQLRGTGAYIFAIHFDYACITCLQSTEARVIAEVGRFNIVFLQVIEHGIIFCSLLFPAVQCNLKRIWHSNTPFQLSFICCFPDIVKFKHL